MRALTVKQPWASLIMAGVKDVENRSWPVPSTVGGWMRCPWCIARWPLGAMPPDGRCVSTRDHGPAQFDGTFPFRLGIHAGKGYDEQAHRLDLDLDYCALPVLLQRDDLPRGALLGTVLVTGCHHANETCRGVCSPWAESGDVWHWTLTDPQPLAEPIPMRGRLGLWTLPDASTAALDGADLALTGGG